ncbi:helix-turn-helix domain-containing protein [Catellatospora methionotrophica]|nr:helix-turn-helix transcriptional regulator [Catellatospora methionotrophica]
MTQPDWPARVAATVASQVKRLREDRKISAQQLADACAGLGYPLQRSVLANFESGRRQTVTLADVYVLAQALGVPPLALMVPVGVAESVEILPGSDVPIVEAMKWLAGEEALPGSDWDGASRELSAISSYKSHATLVENWNKYRHLARHAENAEEVRRNEELAEMMRGELRWLRELMKNRKMTPPALPTEMPPVD